MTTSLKDRIIQSLVERRNKVLNGGINCIPSPFIRFRSEFPGIEQGTYYVITGATKSSKTQITNYLVIYNTILYYYHHPNVIRCKIFFFPLEETKENITLRFMAFLLNYINSDIVINPKDLKSTDERKPCPEDILNMMKDNEEFNKIFDIYEEVVTFYDDRNPTGIYKTMCTYANTHGKVAYKTIEVDELDDLGIKKKVNRDIFDRYIADDPDEYVIIVVDHVGLLTIERDLGTLKATIEKLSEYAILLRNRYNYTYIGVQQQNSETTNLEAFKTSKIRPTKDGLKDSKKPGEDCDVLIGMTCPNSFELPEYMGYNVKKLKSFFKIFEIVLYRGGEANIICPLFHNGAINYYKELPLPTDTQQLNRVYAYMDKLKEQKVRINNLALTLFSWAKRIVTK